MDYMTFISENYVAIILGAVIVLMTIIGYFADKKYSNGSNKPVEKKKIEKEKEFDSVEEFDNPVDIEPDVNDMEDVSNIDMFNEIPSVDPVPVVDNQNNNETNYEDIPEELFEGVENRAEEYNEPITPHIEEPEEVQPIEETEQVQDDNVGETVENNVDEFESVGDDFTESEPVQPVVEEPINVDTQVDSWDSIEPSSDEEGSVSFDEMTDTPVDTVDNSEWSNSNTMPVEEDSIVDNNNIAFDGISDEEFNLPTIDSLDDELASVDSDDDDVWKF